MGFGLELRRSTRKRNTPYTLLGDEIVSVTIKSLHLNIPTLIPTP